MKAGKNYRKILLAAALCVLLNGCGSGGGGGGGSKNPSTTTPITDPAGVGNFKSTDVIIGVIDSSFSYLDDFKDSSGNYRIFIDRTFANDNEKIESNSYSHGDMVAMLIAGNQVGVTQDVKIYAIPSYLGSGDQIRVDASRYQRLYQKGVRIFSQSFGSGKKELNKTNYPENSTLVRFYITRAATDSLFIFSAGNDGKSNPTSQGLFPKLYPKAEKGWITVVGVDPSTKKISADSNRAGDAKNWTIAADFTVAFNKNGSTIYAAGTSFSTPIVSGAAGAVQVKYPWMSRDLIKQSLLTTATDLGAPGVDEIYGWGLVNVNKALKGPAVFDKRLTFDENGSRINDVIIDMKGYSTSKYDIENYSFSNDISGDAGVIKKGTGSIWFTGNNSYTGNTTIQEGTLTITNHLRSNVVIEGDGVFRAVGTTEPYGSVERRVVIDGSVYNNSYAGIGMRVYNGGLKINGNYTGSPTGVVGIDISSSMEVTGTFDGGGGKVTVIYGTKSIPAASVYTKHELLKGGLIKNFNFETTYVNSYFDFKNLNITTQKIEFEYKRNSTEDVVQVLGMTSASVRNTARNIEASFLTANENDKLLSAASEILATPDALLPRTLDSLSAEIYASSQNLVFKQLKELNRDFSNRMVRISNEKNKDGAGIWFNGLGADGKLYQSGYAKADTKLYGGQLGVDKYFNENLLLGAAVSASKAKADFNKYAGKAESTNIIGSLYGIYDFNKTGIYILGAAGIGYVDSDIEREIWINNNSIHMKTDHKDMTYSLYGETGYKLNKGEKFSITPYAGLMYNHIRRGSFEENSSSIYGIKAEKENYEQFSGVIGIRGEVELNQAKIYGGITQVRDFSNEKLDFKAKYVGDTSGNKYHITGIEPGRNTTWINLGAEMEVGKSSTVNISYDISIERDKVSDNLISVGYRYKF